MASDFHRTSARLWFTATMLVATPLLLEGVVRAEPSAGDRETARSLMDDGDRKFEAKNYTGALKAYLGAHSIMGVPSTGAAVARTEEALGHLVEARDAAVLVTRMPVAPHEPAALARARQLADKLAHDLVARIPSLQITIDGLPPGGDARVTIDGAQVPTATLQLPRKANPGKHVVKAEAPGFAPASKEIFLREGESVSASLKMSASSDAPTAAPFGTSLTTSTDSRSQPESAPSTHRISPLVYAGFGVGAVALATGSVTGIMHLSKIASVKKDYCDGGSSCRPGFEAARDDASKFATISNISFLVGAIGVGVGIVGLVTSQSAVEQTPVAHATFHPWVGLNMAGIQGEFR